MAQRRRTDVVSSSTAPGETPSSLPTQAGGTLSHKPGLKGVPSEIFDSIAYYTAISSSEKEAKRPSETDDLPSTSSAQASASTCDDPEDLRGPTTLPGPPSNLVSLLLTCRKFNDSLNQVANPRLYARLFRAKFDTEAIARRFGRAALASRNLADELVRRFVLLGRMRLAVRQGRLTMSESGSRAQEEITENLWLAYMMLMENDGQNLVQLRWASIEAYLALHHSQEMLQSAIQPGYPPDTTDRALALHISYLLTDPEKLAHETREESDEKLFVLRPFVFAAHKFDAFFAPWTMRNLPLLPENSEDTEGAAAEAAEQKRSKQSNNPFLADLTPRSRACTIRHCGQDLRIAPPILSHAACFSFFMKVERDPAVIGLTAIMDGTDGSVQRPQAMVTGTSVSVMRSHRMPLARLRSKDHDRDVARLLSCLDPRSSIGLKPLFFAGQFEGAWEGRFSFFDFDSYREMLVGRMRSLYEGPFGEQPQVWKVRERILRVSSGEPEGGQGSILNAGYPNREDEPLTSMALIVQGARDGQDPTSSVTGVDAYHATQQKEGSTSATTGGRRDLSPTALGKQRAKAGVYEDIARSGRLPSDWHKYPDFGEDETTEDSDDPDRYEILLSGTGHSAWGQFVLRGRVRNWDGMVTMTKEYRPDGRGRWLYRGYAVAGGMLVGRWRDTFTPDNMSGYEGCFLLSRREAS